MCRWIVKVVLAILAGAGTGFAAPRIHLPEPVFEFGARSNREKVNHTFQVENRGDAPLHLIRVEPACGCTLAEVSLRVIPPGGVSEIRTVLDLKGRSGMQRKNISVQTDDPGQPVSYLTLTGTAVAQIEVRPASLFLGAVPLDGSVTGSVEVVLQPDAGIKLTGVRAAGGVFEARLETLESGRHYRVLASLANGTAAVGSIQDVLEVDTSSTETPVIRIPVMANRLDKVVVVPSALTLQTVAGQPPRPITRYLRVQPGTVDRFKVLTVSWPASQAEVQVIEQGGAGVMVQLRNLVPDPKLDQSVITITTDVPGRETLEVPVRVLQFNAPAP